MKPISFFSTRKKQVVVFFVTLVMIILAVYFITEKTRSDQELSEKKNLIVTWMPTISPKGLDDLISTDIYAVYGVPGKNNSNLTEILRLSDTDLSPYLYPTGPVCGSAVNYQGFIEIDLYDKMPVNRTTTDTIYHIIDTHGMVLHHEDTPVIFIRTPLATLDRK
jgi:hypothetical protein